MSPRVLTLLAGFALLPALAAAREATVRLPEGFTATPEPTGFVITHDGRPQLVVDLLNRGRVLMDPALDARQRAWLAALAAALLLSPAVEPG